MTFPRGTKWYRGSGSLPGCQGKPPGPVWPTFFFGMVAEEEEEDAVAAARREKLRRRLAML